MSSVYLRKSQMDDLAEVKIAYENSMQLHQPWTYPPADFNTT
jgi:ribosomal-protein-alanine N-acetyltransferase